MECSLIYSIKNAIYHMLAKGLKLPLVCIEHKIIERAFYGCNVGFKVRVRDGQKGFGNVEL